MRALIMLYKKEMKSIRDIGIALCVTILSALMVACIGEFFYIYRLPNLTHYNYPDILTNKGYLFVQGGPYILAVLLGYTFFIEIKIRTDYLLLSLPVHRSFVMAGKLFAVLSYAILLSFGAALILTLRDPLRQTVLYTHRGSLYPHNYFKIDLLWSRFTAVLWISSVQYFIMLSITAVAIGIIHVVKRQRILIAVSVFILLHGVYDLTLRFIPWFTSRSSISSIEIAVYWFTEGIILSMIGFYLYQQYAEV